MLETINEFNSRSNAASNFRTYSVLKIKSNDYPLAFNFELPANFSRTPEYKGADF